MVSTRGIKYTFSEGEKVLCYEPDPTKAKVLYDSKVLEIHETKDRRGRKVVEYLIHFQGWNSSWDRRVSEDFVLKDTSENRQLQKDLADKSQLYLGAFLYRRERRKRNSKSSLSGSESKIRNRGSSEDGSSNEFGSMQEHDTESYSSSAESVNDEEKILIHVSENLKQYLEYDYNMIVNNEKLINLPAKIPIVAILEHFVKHYSIKMICDHIKRERPRRRNSQPSSDKDASEFEKLEISVNLYKEVADGLRIYFDFTLNNHLLYKGEKEQAAILLSEENLKNFTYTTLCEKPYLEFLTLKRESPNTPVSDKSESQTSASEHPEDNCRRRLRSYKNEDNESTVDLASGKQDNCLSSVLSSSSGSSTPHANNVTDILKTVLPLNMNIPIRLKILLQNVISWNILPSDAPPEPSMIYGAIHLARLIVKLPEFLSAITMSDEKLKTLLKYLDDFLEFLEDQKDWFGEQQYRDAKEVQGESTKTEK